MIEYFQGADDDYYYRVKAANGETLATSEGYTSESDAKRGFEALKRAVAASVFAPEWPHGIQIFEGMPKLVGDDQIMDLQAKRSIPFQRIESGPVQFGDDWPGLWLRGDSCFAYALALRAEKADKSDAFARAGVDGLITALESTNINRERGASST